MILKKQPILFLNKLSSNNRIYTHEAGARIITKINNAEVYGQIGYPKDLTVVKSTDSNQASHKIIRAFIENDVVYADIEILDTEQGNMLKEKIETSVFRPLTEGVLNGNEVEVLSLVSVDAVEKEKDAFGNINENE